MPSSFSTIRLERDGAVAKLTLARPDNANALNMEMSRELNSASIELDEDRSVRAVILTGEGKMFCAGGDLAGMKAAGDKASSFVKELAGNLHLAVSRFARMRAPIIAAVNGTAAGAGFSMMCAIPASSASAAPSS
jgi:2-(1,2-epoxy-1,2-dihydrophenyl)acetyl-CoA isomerase